LCPLQRRSTAGAELDVLIEVSLRKTQPIQGWGNKGRLPRVARCAQPWALRQNPVGIHLIGYQRSKLTKFVAKFGCQRFCHQKSMGVHDWHPCRDAGFKWTFSGGVALLNHRLQYVMPLASSHTFFETSLPTSRKIWVSKILAKFGCQRFCHQKSMGVHDWHPCRDAGFEWTFSGGVALLNHRLQYVMPPASRHTFFETSLPTSNSKCSKIWVSKILTLSKILTKILSSKEHGCS
jgi:hypothetical protein